MSESIRMLLANLKFSFTKNKENSDMATKILVTSSIKGEGKTLVSSNIASLLSSTQKVILLGADLRNPQIHKILNIDRSTNGLTDILYKGDFTSYKDSLLKYDNLDILLSGTIPPNPGEILSSNLFKEFLSLLDKEYDYIIIDSAPCLLVSDTFEISKYADFTMYIARANYSPNSIVQYINDCFEQEKQKILRLC